MPLRNVLWLLDTLNVPLEVRINDTAYHPKQIFVAVYEVIHAYNERQEYRSHSGDLEPTKMSSFKSPLR